MQILRCNPSFFDVEYSINPHMKPGTVDREKALSQWNMLGDIYQSLGLECLEIEPVEGLPDMVFTANQSFPFLKKDGSRAVLISAMANEQRQAEELYFKDWYEKNGFEVFEPPRGLGSLEGMGDMIYHEDKSFLWAGYGFRTTLNMHEYVHQVLGLPVISLKLVDPCFYHLDVCLSVLGNGVAMVYRPAFDEASYNLLKEKFDDLIELTKEEAFNFAGNAHCPDAKNVIIEKDNLRVENELKKRGFNVIPVDTSEYIKSGGSVFCMKMDLP